MPHFIERTGESEKHKPSRAAPELRAIERPASEHAYAELTCFSSYSFLRGASHADELVARAAELGLHAIAVTDLHSLAGVVRAHVAAEEAGVKLVIGARVEPSDAPPVCLYPLNRRGYSNLCRLLSTGKRRTVKGECALTFADLVEFNAELQAIACPPHGAQASTLRQYRELFGDRLSLAISRHFAADDVERIAARERLAVESGIALVATNDVHMHAAERKPLHDVLTCIRHTTTIHEAGSLLFPNDDRRLKSGDEMAALLPERLHHALARSVAIANACTFSLNELRYEYPSEITEDGLSMQDYLRRETYRGAQRRYRDEIPERVRTTIEHELKLIDELNYAAYFLTVYDIVRFARGRGILCQGRGSAANSAVCFCLGITSVDPGRFDLLFERFISAERNEPPDIDVDFEHERREEVLQYVYNKYGRERAALTAVVISYRSRSAIREVGKALGLSLDQVDKLAKARQWFDDHANTPEQIRQAGVDPNDRTVQLALRLSQEIAGFPRHLSQHVGGMVIARGRLDELVPIENAAMEDRTVIEWDKDDLDALNFLKVDILALGMLAAVRKCFHMIEHHGGRHLDMASVLDTDAQQAPESRAIYNMLHKANSIGTFQVESRAQMSMLPRLKPYCFYDLVVEVAIVRPGPIQGGMVHPYLRRRRGEEPVVYPHASLKPVLERTLGVPLFQEQAMQLAVVGAGFTPGEADKLRKAMGAWRRTGQIAKYRDKLIDGMRERGITAEFAERVYKQIEGFGEYGFPESHAISFALIAYVSCYLKRFYPAAFTACVINSQPMGFYSVASLVRDAREHGVEVRPVAIDASDWDCTLEPADPTQPLAPAPLDTPPSEWGIDGPALRLGMRLVKGIDEETGEAIVAARKAGPFRGLVDAVDRIERAATKPQTLYANLRRLAAADAFACLGASRRDALWLLQSRGAPVPALFANAAPTEPEVALPAMGDHPAMVADYQMTGLSLNAHPVEFIRDHLRAAGIATTDDLKNSPAGRHLFVGGLVTLRQRPATAKGTLFMTLEDETGYANLIVRAHVFETYRTLALTSVVLIAEGRVERDGDVVHLLVSKFHEAQDLLPNASEDDLAVEGRSRNFR